MQVLRPNTAFRDQPIARFDNVSSFHGTNSVSGSSVDYSEDRSRFFPAQESRRSSNLTDPNDFPVFHKVCQFHLTIAEILNTDPFFPGTTWTSTHGRQTASRSVNTQSSLCPGRWLRNRTETKRVGWPWSYSTGVHSFAYILYPTAVMVTEFPQEIVDEIIDHLANDKATRPARLQDCSLASSQSSTCSTRCGLRT